MASVCRIRMQTVIHFVSPVAGESSVYFARYHENAECIFHYIIYHIDNGTMSMLYHALCVIFSMVL